VVPETFTVIVVLWKARKRNHVAGDSGDGTERRAPGKW